MNNTAGQKLTKAKTALLLDSPFFGTLLLRFRTEERQDISTAATDGKSLFYNPSFINSLTGDFLKAVLAHEVMHVALLHHTRREKRDAQKWNIAADLAINPLLIKSGFKLPQGALLAQEFKGMTAEEIYKRLPDDGQGQGQGQGGSGQGQGGSDPGNMGGVMDAPHDGPEGSALTAEERAQAEESAKIATQQAAQAAKAAGSIPGGIRRIVEEIINPRLPWQDILRRFINSVAKNDYTWTIPNRRYISAGLYLPSMLSEQVGNIVLAIDTSGSIDNEALAQFGAELSAILDYINAELTVIYCDAQIQKVETYTKSDLPLRLQAHGGGGTDFRPPFKYVHENGLNPVVFIYFTDLQCWAWPHEAPDYPVLWAAYDSGETEVPFGEIMRIV